MNHKEKILDRELMVSEREQRLAKFVARWLDKMPTRMQDAARHAIDGTPIPDYALEQAKWLIAQYGPEYAKRAWFLKVYRRYYKELDLTKYLPNDIDCSPLFKDTKKEKI